MNKESAQNRIIEIISHNGTMRFSEIEKFFDMESNKFSYYLTDLKNRDILEKNEKGYSLTDEGKRISVYLRHGKLTPLTVIVVAPILEDKILLNKREKELYRGFYAFPGFTMDFGKTPEECISKSEEKFGLRLDNIQYKRTFIQIDNDSDGRPINHLTILLYTATPLNSPTNFKEFNLKTPAGNILPSTLEALEKLDDKGIGILKTKIENDDIQAV